MAPLTPSDAEDETFIPTPKIIKYDLSLNDKENLNTENKVTGSFALVKSEKNNVPSNITCHCAGKLIYNLHLHTTSFNASILRLFKTRFSNWFKTYSS